MDDTTERADVTSETEGVESLVARAASGAIDKDDRNGQEDATAWFLDAFAGETPEVQNTLIVNVGGVGDARKDIRWKIKALDGPLIRKIRENAESLVRRQGSSGAGATSAGFNANVRIVIEGSTDPDIKTLARQQGIADPTAMLEVVLQKKQGLIDQIAGSILTLSGYDQDDVQDEIEVRAAGN